MKPVHYLSGKITYNFTDQRGTWHTIKSQFENCTSKWNRNQYLFNRNKVSDDKKHIWINSLRTRVTFLPNDHWERDPTLCGPPNYIIETICQLWSSWFVKNNYQFGASLGKMKRRRCYYLLIFATKSLHYKEMTVCWQALSHIIHLVRAVLLSQQ